MRTNAKKLLVQRSQHKRKSNCSAGHLLAARMNVRSHHYDCEYIFLWSTASRWIAFACSPNICCISEWRWMLSVYTSTLCVFAFAYKCGRGLKVLYFHFLVWVDTLSLQKQNASKFHCKNELLLNFILNMKLYWISLQKLNICVFLNFIEKMNWFWILLWKWNGSEFHFLKNKTVKNFIAKTKWRGLIGSWFEMGNLLHSPICITSLPLWTMRGHCSIAGGGHSKDQFLHWHLRTCSCWDELLLSQLSSELRPLSAFPQ